MALRPARLAIVLAAAAWLAAGGVGTYLYAHRYWLYRGFPPPVTPAGVAKGAVEHVSFFSPALRERREMMVYLPAGYRQQAAAGHRFPVLYLLHAAPGRPDGFFLAGAVGVTADTLIARHAIAPMLLVVPFGKTPRFHSDTEWADSRAGPWMRFALDAVRAVDRRFATVRSRQGRAIAGLSEGGYGALNVALHHLGVFGGVQSWSGYFEQTPTGPFAGAPPAVIAANSPQALAVRRAREIRRLGLRAWLYQGKIDFTAPRRIRTFASVLASAGATVDYGFFAGGHDWGLWRRQTPRMLRAASRWFTHPPAHTGSLALIGHPLPHALWHRILFNPHRRCAIKHPPRGFRFPRYCAALRAAERRRRAHRGARGPGAAAAAPASAGGGAPVSDQPILHGPGRRRWVALTFDADMTEGMLRALRSGRVRTWVDHRLFHELEATRTPATIFLTGLWTRTYASTVRSLRAHRIFEFENHTYDHAAWTGTCFGLPGVIGTAAKRAEVLRTQAVIRRVAGVEPRFFRFPGGCATPADLRLVASLGERPVDWSVVSGDAFQRDPALIVRDVLAEVRPGAIVVAHCIGAPNAPATARAFARLIPALRARGYRFVTLRTLLGQRSAHAG